LNPGSNEWGQGGANHETKTGLEGETSFLFERARGGGTGIQGGGQSNGLTATLLWVNRLGESGKYPDVWGKGKKGKGKKDYSRRGARG